MSDDPICENCETEYALRSGCEPTPYCDTCVHLMVDTLRSERDAALALAEQRLGLLREIEWSGSVKQHGSAICPSCAGTYHSDGCRLADALRGDAKLEERCITKPGDHIQAWAGKIPERIQSEINAAIQAGKAERDENHAWSDNTPLEQKCLRCGVPRPVVVRAYPRFRKCPAPGW